MASARTLDQSALPDVRAAQGALVASIFSHPAFDKEGDQMFGKLFYVFEETVANNEALEVAHLGEDTEGATKAALENSLTNNELLITDGQDGKAELLKLAKEKYGAQGKNVIDLEDVDLGSEIKAKAQAVVGAAKKVLGR